MNIVERISQNWKSGLTVALVSIPLSVSLAVASQTSPTVGIITAIWAGITVSILGGSNYNIVGPTGALSGILATYAIIHGASSLPMLAVVAGVMILVAYFFKLERFLIFVPASTIHGFTLGVAFIIALNQLNYILGISVITKHEKFIENVMESIRHIPDGSVAAVVIFLVFLAGLFAFLKFLPKVPGAIVLAPVGILFGYLGTIGLLPSYLLVQTLGSKYPEIQGKLFEMPKFFFDNSLLAAAGTVAFVAILETMISAKIADGMTKTKHDKRKEMFGLGAANIVSGLMGGIPATAALARTSLNIKSGATDKMSATISSIAIGLISVVFLTYFSYIPLAVVAAILVFTAVRMVEMKHFVYFAKHHKHELVIALVVAFITIYEDPIYGILVGMAISLLLHMDKLSKGHFDVVFNKVDEGIIAKVSGTTLSTDLPSKTDTLVYSVKGTLTYINAQSHLARFEDSLSGYKHVVLRLRELSFIDVDGIEVLDEIVSVIQSHRKLVVMSSISDLVKENLQNESEEYRKLLEKGLIFESTSEALRYLGHNP